MAIKPHQFTNRDVQRMKALYALGHEICKIAAQFDCSAAAIRRHIKDEITIKKTINVKRKSEESELQRSVVRSLRMAGIFVLSIPNEGKRTRYTGKNLKDMGLRAGAGDILIIDKSIKSHFMEFKSIEGAQSQNQEIFEADCVTRGIPYAVVRTFNAAIDQCKQWGVL